MNLGCDRRTGDTVTAGIERRTRNKEIGVYALDHLDDLSLSLIKVLVEITVAADDRFDDLSLFAPRGVKRKTRSNRTVAKFRSDVRHLFAADLGKELVDIL